MPPKKKKPAINPIVVGTVSTRSTRRESIVNIEIPKLKATVKNSKISKEKDKESSAVIQTSDPKSTALNFSEKIKETYNNMINRCMDSSLLVKRADITEVKSKSKTSPQSPISPSKIARIIGATIPTKPRGKLKSNEALLQILEDWTDDDSQEDKKDTSEVNSSDDADSKLYQVQENENKSSDDEKDIMLGIEQDINKGSLSTKRLLQTLEGSRNEDESAGDDVEQMQNYKKDKVKIEITEVTGGDSLESSDTEAIIEEYIVEENVIEEHVEQSVAFEDSGFIVECVTEEIIEEENDSQHISMEITEGVIAQTVSEDSQEAVERQVVVSTEPNQEKAGFEDSQPSSDQDNINTTTAVRENLILEETSQSVSTSDSNDAEVRGFFTKEIENNEIVNHESFPDIEYELVEEVRSASRGNADSLTSMLEENLESEIAADVKNINISTDNSPLESESNSEGLKEQSKGIMLANIKGHNGCKSKEDIIVKEESGEIKKCDIADQMDITDFGSDESIESKVAQLHLKDDNVKEEPFKYDEVKMEVEEPEEKIPAGFLKDEKEIELNVERPPLRRTRSRDFKSPKIDVEDQKPTKSKEKKPPKPKDPKSKEVKPPKDSKSKKKVPTTSAVKKFKEKPDKKDSGKTDKKETSKRSSKSDSDTSKKPSNSDFEDMEVRRSSRIKSISVLKKKTTGHGLVRSKSEPSLNESDISDSNSTQNESEKSTPSASPKVSGRERRSRWTRSSENLSQLAMDVVMNKSDGSFSQVTRMEVDEKPKLPMSDPVVKARLKQFVHLKENSYKTDRMTCKEAKKMTCDCFLTSEEIQKGELGCGDDCLNRLLLIECGNLCSVGNRCTNKRFQSGQFAPVEVFNTDKKGLGLRAAANIPYGEFILEYVGEVLNCNEFDKRAEVYSQDKNIHYYFMSLRADAIIDATAKGNISRFINHSCDPNAETQKWTVNGELRIGFFSTRTILAGEEITFDYRFQRYGKEAQKCYCEAATCRGWLGEQPDEDSEDDDEEEEEEEEEQIPATVKVETPEVPELQKPKDEEKPAEVAIALVKDEVKVEKETTPIELPATPVAVKRKSQRKKPRKDLFEDLDQLEEEIEMLVTTGLKNQAHTLKLSRLMVRAKEPAQRTKLLRILRRGELPCRRLFLDYHGLRLMHGYMIDAQHLVHSDKKYESLRLEMLQTLAVLPIPNKTMLQDSKVLPTVDKWSTNKDDFSSPLDSDSNSPKNEQDATQTPKEDTSKDKNKEPTKKTDDEKKDVGTIERSIEDQEEEIRFLATKLLEGWTNLKEVFRIPKKERIEQMKEHEREANKKFMQSGYGGEQDSGRKSDRYRHLSRYKFERDSNRKGCKSGDKPSAEFIRLSKIERRKLFALQHELKEEERRMKQREMWRQHEINCMLIGTDPRFTAPFDPSRGFQCIWNPQIGQWQNYPLPPQSQPLYSPQPPTPSNISLPTLPNLNLPPPMQIPKSIPSFSFPQIGIPTSLNGGLAQISTSMAISGQVPLPPTSVSQIHIPSQIQTMPPSVQQITSMQGIPGALPQNIPTHPQVPSTMPSTQLSVVNYQEPIKKEEDPSQVKFMGPIPPPAKLPPKWKCAKDKYGRPYYYHIKMRKSQWEPPPLQELSEEPDESSETESSSDTSSISSDTSSENSESDDDIDDTRLLMEVRKQMEKSAKLTLKTAITDQVKMEEVPQFSPSPDSPDRNSEDDMENDEDVTMTPSFTEDDLERPSIDIRLKEQFNLLKDDKPPKKKRRTGLCEEIIISPRTEEDKLQFREDLKKYKANKEKLKRQKDLILQQTRKQLRECEPIKLKEKRTKSSMKTRIKEMSDFNSEAAKKIKETFRSNMASTVVGALNGYRKSDCKEGKITNTEDFKHLARKLTHFVMLKEMKHIAKIEDLTCTDNVKSKAREYIKKYMSKFGEVYIKRNDSPDFKD